MSFISYFKIIQGTSINLYFQICSQISRSLNIDKFDHGHFEYFTHYYKPIPWLYNSDSCRFHILYISNIRIMDGEYGLWSSFTSGILDNKCYVRSLFTWKKRGMGSNSHKSPKKIAYIDILQCDFSFRKLTHASSTEVPIKTAVCLLHW